jgi:hypothetical protein
MTLEEFRATRRPSDNLGRDLPGVFFSDEDPVATGFIYLNSLYIENIGYWWPIAAKNAGKYYLLLERLEFFSNDLAELEQKLYDFAIYNGFTEET